MVNKNENKNDKKHTSTEEKQKNPTITLKKNMLPDTIAHLNLMELITSIREIDSIVSYLLEVFSSSSTTIGTSLSHILLELITSKSANLSPKECKLFDLFSQFKAMTAEEIREHMKFKSRKWPRDMCTRLWEDGFLGRVPHTIGDFRPILVYHVKSATKDDVFRAADAYSKLKNSNKDTIQQLFKCIRCNHVFMHVNYPKQCPNKKCENTTHFLLFE